METRKTAQTLRITGPVAPPCCPQEGGGSDPQQLKGCSSALSFTCLHQMSAALILFKQVNRGGANALRLRLHFPPAVAAESSHRACGCGGRTGPDTGRSGVFRVQQQRTAERRFGHDSSREAERSGGADLPECGSADGR